MWIVIVGWLQINEINVSTFDLIISNKLLLSGRFKHLKISGHTTIYVNGILFIDEVIEFFKDSTGMKPQSLAGGAGYLWPLIMNKPLIA